MFSSVNYRQLMNLIV